MNKPQTFEEVTNYLSQIPCIHSGGCGISALAMYKWLKKDKNFDDYEFRFVICYESWQDDEASHNMAALKDKHTLPVATSHTAIYYDGSVIDCFGTIALNHYYYYQFVRHDWFVTNMINNVGTWNRAFDRRNISRIEHMLDINLSEIKINSSWE